MEDLDKYRGNAHNQRDSPNKEEPKKHKIQQVTRRAPVQKQKSVWARVRENFIEEDRRSIGEHVLMEVIVPKIKDMLFDTVTEGAHRTLYADAPSRQASPYSRGVSTQANRYHRPTGRTRREEPAPPVRSFDRRERAMHDFSSLVFDSAGEAEEVIMRLQDHLVEYGVVTVNDFYDAVGLTGEFTDDSFGWTDLRNARVRKIREGYILDLPRTIEID